MRKIRFKLEGRTGYRVVLFLVLLPRKMSQILFDKIIFHFFGKGLLQF